MDAGEFHASVVRMADVVDADVIQPPENLGGHGGFNFALRKMAVRPDDLVLGYDPDTYPVTEGWLQAMIDVMRADPAIGYVSLMDRRIIPNRPWMVSEIGGRRFASHPDPEMWNCTMFRGSMLADGLLAKSRYYGHVEVAMAEQAEARGMRHGYLLDFQEDAHPIPHPETYRKWKRLHASQQYPGNFARWVEEKR